MRPNICYWCGQLSHEDKDCILWLQSKCSLSTDDQQFGAWIRASQYNPSKKVMIKVQGFDAPGSNDGQTQTQECG